MYCNVTVRRVRATIVAVEKQYYIFFIPTRLWRWNRQCVPKLWHIKSRSRVITQMKTYNNII